MALLHLTSFAALQWVYLNGIASTFGSDGYSRILGGQSEDFNAYKTTIAVICSFFLPLTIRKSIYPSTLFLHIIMAFTIIPVLVIYASADLPNEFVAISIAAFLIVSTISRLPAPHFSERMSVGSKAMLLASIMILGVFVASFIVFGGFRYLNFNFKLVYELRTEARENLPGIYSYLSSAVTKTLIPFAMALACVHRAYLMIFLLSACSVLIFGLTANKAPIFFPFVVIGIYYFYPLGRAPMWAVLAVLTAVVASGLGIWAYLNISSEIGGWIAALLGNRTLMLPALINYAYYDQFVDGARFWWSESRLSLGLVKRPFAEASPSLIGMNYFGRPEVFANTGWIGSGYAQAGLWGVAIYSIGIGLILLIIDGFGKKFGDRVTVSMFIVLVLTMISASDFVVMFLTHGMLLALLLARFTSGADIRRAAICHKARRASFSESVHLMPPRQT